jgi:hypothetical protein
MEKTPITNKEKLWNSMLYVDALYINGICHTIKNILRRDGQEQIHLNDNFFITIDDLDVKLEYTHQDGPNRFRTIYLKDGSSVQMIKYTTVEFED